MKSPRPMALLLCVLVLGACARRPDGSKSTPEVGPAPLNPVDAFKVKALEPLTFKPSVELSEKFTLPFLPNGIAVTPDSKRLILWQSPVQFEQRGLRQKRVEGTYREEYRRAVLDLENNKVVHQETSNDYFIGVLATNHLLVLWGDKDSADIHLRKIDDFSLVKTITTNGPMDDAAVYDDLVVCRRRIKSKERFSRTQLEAEVFDLTKKKRVAHYVDKLEPFNDFPGIDQRDYFHPGVKYDGILLGSYLYDGNMKPKLCFGVSDLPWAGSGRSGYVSRAEFGVDRPSSIVIRSDRVSAIPQDVPFRILAHYQAKVTGKNERPKYVRGKPTPPQLGTYQMKAWLELADHDQKLRVGVMGPRIDLPVFSTTGSMLRSYRGPDCRLVCSRDYVFFQAGNQVRVKSLADVLGKRPVEKLTFTHWYRRQSVFEIAGPGPTTLPHVTFSAKQPYYDLANTIDGMSIDHTTGTVTIEHQEFYRSLADSLVKGIVKARTTPTNMEYFIKSEKKYIEKARSVLGHAPKGCPVKVSIKIFVRAGDGDQAMIRYTVVVDLPRDLVVEKLKRLDAGG